MNIIYFGTPEFSADILEGIIKLFSQIKEPNLQIKAVITSPDKPVGRKQVITESATAKIAQKYDIPVFKPAKLNEEFIKNHLSILEADLYIVAAYGKIVPKKLLDIPKYGAINVHPSLLPKYRGASPIQTAILNGEEESGVTIMKMDEEVDHGDILSVKKISISEEDNYQTLSKKISQLTAPLLAVTVVEYLNSSIVLKQQDHTRAVFTKIIHKDDGFFEIDHPPAIEILDRMIRAYYPWPNVWTRWNGKIVKFYPGQLIQLEGKKPVKLTDFLRGYPNFPLKTLK